MALADEADNGSGECLPLVQSDTNGVSSTSLPRLLARANNPACKAKFLRLPLVRQTKGYTCGAASLKAILYYFGDFFAETELQRILRSHNVNGTSFKRIMRFLSALNDKDQREKLMAVYGFDTKVDLNELSIVLNDPSVLSAIKAKKASNPAFAAVLKGLNELKTSAIDIDKLGSVGGGLSLTGEDPIDPFGPTDNGHRLQLVEAPLPAEPSQNKYSTQLFVARRPFRPAGPLPAGCPETPPPPPPGTVTPVRGMTLDDLTKAIDDGSPILALTQAWSYTSDEDYDLKEYEHSWYSGHYVVVVGYDQKNIYYMDPYTLGHYAFLPKEEWERRWHDYDGLLAADEATRCPGGTELEHFGLVVKRQGGATYDQDLITKMY